MEVDKVKFRELQWGGGSIIKKEMEEEEISNSKESVKATVMHNVL